MKHKILHIWDFPNYEKINIFLDASFKNDISKRIKDKFKTWKECYNFIQPNSIENISFTYFKHIFEPNCHFYIPLWLCLHVCDFLNIQRETLEKHVLFYRLKKGCSIEAKLPIFIDPLFDMTIAHMFGDGCVRQSKNRIVKFDYRQYDENLRKLFLERVEKIFGKINVNYAIDIDRRIYLPASISNILLNYYSLKVNQFNSTKGTFPEILLTQPKENLLAILIALIIDDGYIDSSEIVVAQCNENFIRSLGKISHKLGYDYKLTADGRKFWHLWIKAGSVEKFYHDYLKLKKEYPSISLGYKEDKLKLFIERKNRTWKDSGKGIIKNKLIDLLSHGEMSTNELVRQLGITRQGIREHIRNLTTKDIIIIHEKRKNEFVYKLVKKIKFEELKKESRPNGITKSKILELLKKPKTINDMTSILNINRANIRHHLDDLETIGKIKRYGKQKGKTNAHVIWGVCK